MIFFTNLDCEEEPIIATAIKYDLCINYKERVKELNSKVLHELKKTLVFPFSYAIIISFDQ